MKRTAQSPATGPEAARHRETDRRRVRQSDERNNRGMNSPQAIASGLMDFPDDRAGDVHVLADGRRVMSEAAVVVALFGDSPVGSFGELISALPSHMAKQLTNRTIRFTCLHGSVIRGYDHEFLVDLCQAWVDFGTQGRVDRRYRRVVRNSRRILYGLANFGLRCAIDDAVFTEEADETLDESDALDPESDVRPAYRIAHVAVCQL